MAAAQREGEIGVIFVTDIVEPEGDQFVSYCRELGTTSCGDTVGEAFKNLDEAIGVHLEALLDTGELHQFLRERNINIVVAPDDDLQELNLPVPLGRILLVAQHSVPVFA